MKSARQKLSESILKVVFSRRDSKFFTNQKLSSIHHVSVTTIANKAKRLNDEIDSFEHLFDEVIEDERFHLRNLDADIAIVVIDNLVRARDVNEEIRFSSNRAIRTQFKRIWDDRQEQYKNDRVIAKQLGII